MSVSFTSLNVFTTSDRLDLSPDLQIVEFVKLLDGKITNWQIVSPSPNKRILYYEMEDGKQAKQVTGSQLDVRMESLGEIKKIKKERSNKK